MASHPPWSDASRHREVLSFCFVSFRFVSFPFLFPVVAAAREASVLVLHRRTFRFSADQSKHRVVFQRR